MHHRFRSLIIYILILFILIQCLLPTTVHAYPDSTWPSGPSVESDAAIVMELSTGTVLYEKNSKKAEYPASITKIMTALLAVENCSMDETVTFSHEAVYGNGTNSSSIGMNVGESLSMEYCMYGMMLASANEVAKAIGEHISGDLDSFVDLMNKRASELGCVNTHFNNANGLHDENHYTCAYDMALIARQVIKNSTFKKIAGTRVFVIPPTEIMDEDRWVANTHQMINPSKLPRFRYEDCYAGKTGFTDEARYTLVSFAKRGALDVVCVVMKAPRQVNQYEDSISLLNFAFDNFSMHAIRKLDSAPAFDNYSLFTRFSHYFNMSNSPLSIDTDSCVVLPNGASYSDVTQSISYTDPESVHVGTNVIGTISYQYNSITIGSTDILFESSDTLDFDYIHYPEPSEPVEEEPEEIDESHRSLGLVPLIIIIIIIILAILGGVYYCLVELPHRRKRRAFYEKRKQRIEQDEFSKL